MVPVIHRPLNAVASTVATVRSAVRILLPLAITLAITVGGLLVFFALVIAVF